MRINKKRKAKRGIPWIIQGLKFKPTNKKERMKREKNRPKNKIARLSRRVNRKK